LAELEPPRRYATLTALVLELTATLTDEALNMFEHLVGQVFKRSERAHAKRYSVNGILSVSCAHPLFSADVRACRSSAGRENLWR
jgi:hypothetical protein